MRADARRVRCHGEPKPTSSAATNARAQRTFFIQAEIERRWSYVDDSDRDLARQTLLEPRQREQTVRDASHLGSTFIKAVYVQYTDASFKTRVVRRAAEEVSAIVWFFVRFTP